MNNVIKSFFEDNKIEYYANIPLSACKVKKKYLLERYAPFARSVYLFIVPYFCGLDEPEGISLYARSYDYHLYFRSLFDELTAILKVKLPQDSFYGFCDHSPISEVDAAAKAELGVKGDNGLLINEKYGSFVFIGGLFSSEEPQGEASAHIGECLHCGSCRRACPACLDMTSCLSDITQKKGELAPDERAMVKKYRSVWGCDMCQTCCPHNRDIQCTPISFFYENRISSLDRETVLSMPEGEFSKRAFSWRGRECLVRNLDIINED